MTGNPSSSDSSASMLHGHAAYAAAAAKETLGSYTSTDMQKAGIHEKQAAVEEMRAAKAHNESTSSNSVEGQHPTIGGIEENLGKITGCEGMKDEGSRRQA